MLTPAYRAAATNAPPAATSRTPPDQEGPPDMTHECSLCNAENISTCPNNQSDPLTAFARRIVALYDVDGPGAEARRTVTLNQIIGWARDALGEPDPA